MTKEGVVRVRGIQFVIGGDQRQEEAEPVEVFSMGEYYFRNGTHYIKYDEMMGGFTEKTQNLIKIRDHSVELRKKGLTNVHMVFEEQKKNISYYQTPFGTMEMGIAATRVDMKQEEDEMNVHIEYALEVNESHVADCDIQIGVASREKKEFLAEAYRW